MSFCPQKSSQCPKLDDLNILNKKDDIAQGAHITYKAGDSVFCSQTL